MSLLSLDDLATILGCSKAAASLVRSGKYDRPSSDLLTRYHALLRVTAHVDRAEVLQQLCCECPREDCTGCRVAEIETRGSGLVARENEHDHEHEERTRPTNHGKE